MGETVPGRSLSGTWAEGGETSGSENETRLIAAGQPGRTATSLAAMQGTAGLPQYRRLPGMAYFSVGLQVADEDNLLPRPDRDGEGVRSAAQDSVGSS